MLCAQLAELCIKLGMGDGTVRTIVASLLGHDLGKPICFRELCSLRDWKCSKGSASSKIARRRLLARPMSVLLNILLLKAAEILTGPVGMKGQTPVHWQSSNSVTKSLKRHRDVLGICCWPPSQARDTGRKTWRFVRYPADILRKPQI